MNTPQGPYLFAAVHKGPYLSIQPVEAALSPEHGLYLVAGVSKDERARDGLPFTDPGILVKKWGNLENFLIERQVSAIVRGSSVDVQKSNVEDLASAAGESAGTPVFVVEDFPGNYQAAPGCRLDGLFVEDQTTAEFHASRGIATEVIHPIGNPRYDSLSRMANDSGRDRIREALGLNGETAMLWAGQPDGPNSYLALERLLNHLPDGDFTLLFRAHPRDPAYGSGGYEGLLANAGVRTIDVSGVPDVLSLYGAADLVATQFSSAGVEASHLGVPALFVLFEDLGREQLRASKGYDSLPWCQDDCAFLINNETDAGTVLASALLDASERGRVAANFRARFGATGNCAEKIANVIRSAISTVAR